jgi:hypothetical protein
MADILSSFLAGGANDPIQLALLRKQQEDEARQNELNQIRMGTVMQTTPGYYELDHSQSDENGLPIVNNHPSATGVNQAGEAARQGEMAFQHALVGDSQKDQSEDPFTGDAATALTDFFDPQVARQRNIQSAQKQAESSAAARATAGGQLAVEQEKNRGLMEQQAAQHAHTDALVGSVNGANRGGAPGQPGAFNPNNTGMKPTINANGGVSFTTTAMPALLQRSYSQLNDARQKTLGALREAERMYPGIADEGLKADNSQSQSWADTLLGTGQKYGGATDLMGAANERLKYTLGIPTPFARLAQEASFGNIEQMAGQLPGVRGLATIVPLFREHQARWGHETPLATVQRLQHMLAIMDDTIQGIEGGDSVDTTPAPAPPYNPQQPIGVQ